MNRNLSLKLQSCLQCPYFRDDKEQQPDLILGDSERTLLCWHPYGKLQTSNVEDITDWFNKDCPLPKCD